MRWHERLIFGLLALSLMALWFPWVDHKSAALVLTGWDLPEFARFMGEVRSGKLALHAEAFYAPAIAFALGAVLVARKPAERRQTGLLRLVLAAAALAVPFPPVGRGKLYGLLLTVSLGLWFFSGRFEAVRLAARLGVPLLGTAASVLPLVEFWRLLPALERLYAAPIVVGLGAWISAICVLTGSGLSLVSLMSAARAIGRGRQAGQRSQRPVGSTP